MAKATGSGAAFREAGREAEVSGVPCARSRNTDGLIESESSLAGGADARKQEIATPAATLTWKASETASIREKFPRTRRTLTNYYGKSGKN